MFLQATQLIKYLTFNFLWWICKLGGGRTIVRLMTDFFVQLYDLWLKWCKRTHCMYSLLPFEVGSAYQISLIENFLIKTSFDFLFLCTVELNRN